MRRTTVLSLLILLTGTGLAAVFAQMGGMGPGWMGQGGVPWNMPGMPGFTFDDQVYASTGERIFFTGTNEAGERIPFTGGPPWLWMGGGGCASCHGPDGRGGFPVMMTAQVPPNITYDALTEGEHGHGGAEAGEEHAPYTDELIMQAITRGVDASGEVLDLTMPRWQMSEEDLTDLLDFLKTLDPGIHEEPPLIGEQVSAIAREYLESLNFPDLRLAELVVYSQSAIAKFQEKSTGKYAFDVLIDLGDGQIYPVMGPTMGWNTRYGNGGMMMGGFFDLRLDIDEARSLARQFLAQANVSGSLGEDHTHTYYGYYEFHLEQNGRTANFITVNGYTGQISHETWLGLVADVTRFPETGSQEQPRLRLVPVRSVLVHDERFSLDIQVEAVHKLAGYQFDLRFDPTMLQVEGVAEGSFLKRDGAGTFWQPPAIDNANGHVRVIAARTTQEGSTGDGSLASIQFHTVGAGDTSLGLEHVLMSDSVGNTMDVSVSGTLLQIQQPQARWDVNTDGSVDIVDLVLVGQRLGGTVEADESPNPDVNRDGEVNVIDLVLIGQHFGETYGEGPPAAPTTWAEDMGAPVVLRTVARHQGTDELWVDVLVDDATNLYGFQFDVLFDPQTLEFAEIQEGDLLRHGGTSTFFQPPRNHASVGRLTNTMATRVSTPEGVGGQGTLASFRFLARESSSDSLVQLANIRLADTQGNRLPVRLEMGSVHETIPHNSDSSGLLQNFPNPFNPDTWIPYQLKEAGDVTVNIYTATGQLVRGFSLGHQPAGSYTTQERAVHWDGRDDVGQPMSSGVYFYRLEAPGLTQTRKMILKK